MVPFCLIIAIGSSKMLNQATQQVATQLPSNHQISTSLTINGGISTQASPDGSAAWTVTSSNVVLDFGGAILRSRPQANSNLDRFTGTGILVKNCHDVTIKNLNIRGYRWNIRLENCQNVTLQNVDASFSRSELIEEPNGHQVGSFLDLRNGSSWSQYGAGVWMSDCAQCQVTDSRANQSQNGLLMVNCQKCQVTNDDFSFNSGWGIGMQNSILNQVDWNHLDFCNRRWDDGWGGDSAALAIANGCNENLFVGDSMTHSGDGFFLTDAVNGGFDDKDHQFHFQGDSNDNIIADCDGSYASANAFECTFSNRNIFLNDNASNSNFGFWIGFSNDTVIGGCKIQNNDTDSIAGGQGARTRIEENDLTGNKSADGEFWSVPGPANTQRPAEDIEIQLADPTQLDLWTFRNASGNIYGPGSSKPLKVWGQPSARCPLPGSVARTRARIQTLLAANEALKPKDFAFYPGSDQPVGPDWLQMGSYAPFDFRSQLAAYHQDPTQIKVKLLVPGLRIEIPNGFQFANSDDQSVVIVQPKPASDFVGRYMPCPIVIKSKSGQSQTIEASFASDAWYYRWATAPSSPTSGKASVAWHGQNWVTVGSIGQVNSFDTVAQSKSPSDLLSALFATSHLDLPSGNLSIYLASTAPTELIVDGIVEASSETGFAHDGPPITIPIKAGRHTVQVRFLKLKTSDNISLNWRLQPETPSG